LSNEDDDIDPVSPGKVKASTVWKWLWTLVTCIRIYTVDKEDPGRRGVGARLLNEGLFAQLENAVKNGSQIVWPSNHPHVIF